MSASELARRLGEHRNWVIDRLTGRVQIKADEVPRFAKVLGVAPSAFFEPADGRINRGTPPEVPDLRPEVVIQALLERLVPRPERELITRLVEAWQSYRLNIVTEHHETRGASSPPGAPAESGQAPPEG
ncbi:MAG: helix-turn-helix transcriptional regulator [Chloroflexi bacterium]|nr:helix-turn-helix transcriptional regulator [Betaproteobacteria bacterium]MBI4213003.1 helix-turn-helix transcriptional regulator [Chloroflexota bacterium]